MSRSRAGAVLRNIRRMVAPDMETGGADAELLRAFVEARDESAFAELVRRHARLVWNVCRGVLRHEQDAEDAFQAAFLALYQNAGKIRKREALASWLYGAASRIARRARRAAERSRRRERSIVPAGPAPPLAEIGLRELQRILAEEVERLPEKYRSPFILCCLEGRSREEAAHQLAWNLGTLSNRLALARERLAQRLARRGVLFSAALTAIDLGAACAAAVPDALVTSIGSTGHINASTRAVAWADAAGRTVMRKAAAGLIVLGLVLGGGLAATSSSDPTPPPPKPPAQAEPAAKQIAVDAQGDPLPDGALRRFGSLRYRHSGINSAVLSPDGKTIAVTSEAALIFFDVETGRQLHVIRESGIRNGFSPFASTLAFAPDGKTVASAVGAGGVRIWDVKTGKEIRRLGSDGLEDTSQPIHVLPEHHPGVSSTLHFCAAGKEIVQSYERHGKVHFQSAQTGKAGGEMAIPGMIWGVTPDGKELLIGDEKSGQVSLINFADGAERKSFRVEGELLALALGADGKTVVAANKASVVWLWDAASGKELAKWNVAWEGNNRRAELTAPAVTGGGKMILAGTTNGPIRRWDVETGKELRPLKGHTWDVTGMFVAPDGRTLISVSWDGLIRRWDLQQGEPISPGPGYGNHMLASLSPDGRLLAAGDADGRLDLWETTTGKLHHHLKLSGASIQTVAFRPDSKELAVARGDGHVVIWDIASGREIRSLEAEVKRKPGDDIRFEALVYSPNGRGLLSSAYEGSMRLWDAATGKQLWSQPGNGKAAFSPDGKQLLTGGWDRKLRFRDAATGTEKRTAVEVEDIIDSIAFSPDSQIVVTSHHDGTIRFRHPATGEERKKLTGHKSVVWEISFSPDGMWLFSAGNDSVRVWEVATGQEVWMRQGHIGRVYQGQFGPDGKTALSSGWDLTALLWTLRPADVPTAKGNAEKLWDDLAATDARRAYRAVWALADDPSTAVELLRAQLPPAKLGVSREQIAALIAELDSTTFRTREGATKALAELGVLAAGQLREALPKAKSPEHQRRIEDLLARLKRDRTPDELRLMRAIAVLERSGTLEARRLLESLATGTAAALLTEEAKSALKRLIP
jgi:RNA polymerase sigma factor (sigma-70 family)